MDRSGRVDLLSVNLDSLPTTSLRSEEDLRRYTLDDNLEGKPIEKALHLLMIGEEIQKISVIVSLTELYKFDPSNCLQRVIPRIHQNLSTAGTEYHLSYCAAIRCLQEEKIIPMDNFSAVFLQTILSGIEHRDSQVVDAWVDCLVNLIQTLPMAILLREIKPVAISKASPTKPVHLRAESCRIIGALCKRFPGPEVDKELIPVIVPLWRDPSPDVRSAMIRQLPHVVRAIGSISDAEYIIGPFVQLVSDELPKVAEVAFAAMVESIPHFSVDTLRESIWPLLREIIIQAFKFDHNLLLVVAQQYGKMVMGLERAIPASEKDIYVKHYISLLDKSSDKQSRSGRDRMGPELCSACRNHCAMNYIDMVKFSYNENNRTLIDQLHVALGDLITDHYWECRKTIAINLYDIIINYGKYNYGLKKEINIVLNDSLVEVIDGIIPRLAEILVIFYRAGYYLKDQETSSAELLKSLEHCENTLLAGYNWRAYSKFVNQLEIMWYIFSPDIVYNKFVDLMFKRLVSCRNLQSRLAILRAILVNLKYIPRAFYKAETKNKIIDLSNSPNFYDRMLFLRSIDIVLDIHSTLFFKDHYFLRTVQMSDDLVPNVRWAVCSLLPRLHAMVRQPEDKVLLTITEEVIQQLTNDKDKDVLEAIKKAKTEIESNTFLLLPNDQKNYDEERLLQNLNPKQIQLFPESVTSSIEPTVLGKSVAYRESSGARTMSEPTPVAHPTPRRRSGRSAANRSNSTSSSSGSTGTPRGRSVPPRKPR